MSNLNDVSVILRDSLVRMRSAEYSEKMRKAGYKEAIAYYYDEELDDLFGWISRYDGSMFSLSEYLWDKHKDADVFVRSVLLELTLYIKECDNHPHFAEVHYEMWDLLRTMTAAAMVTEIKTVAEIDGFLMPALYLAKALFVYIHLPRCEFTVRENRDDILNELDLYLGD